LFVLVYPIVISVALWKYRNQVGSDRIYKKISAAYDGIDFRRNKKNLLYYPIFLWRRFIFIWTPVVLGSQVPLLQVLALIIFSWLTAIYYFWFRPHIGYRKQKTEMFNEFMIMILSYHMLLFTKYVEIDI
jgi:type IV secretory pathway TrbL component